MTSRTSPRRALHAAWILANVLGVLACLGAIALIVLASAIALGRIELGWDTFAWLAVADAGTAVVSLAASGGLFRRDAPPGSWATH